MKAEEVLIYLASCSINNTFPANGEIIDSVSRDELFQAASFHQMTAIAAYALQKAGYRDERFQEERLRTASRNVQYNVERAKILAELEKAQIWYMPLKGILMKDYYPQAGMRQMCDNDILFDANRADKIREIMLAHGYRTEIYNTGHRDHYIKAPAFSFEMHRVLFDQKTIPEVFFHYYREVKKRLIKDENNLFGFHFSDEDFYIYMIAHEYKHYVWGGTGLRSLLDVYIYTKKMGETLDWAYIAAETEKLCIKEFEEKTRDLAHKVFSAGSTEQLTPEERRLLLYYLNSGAYGIKDYIILNSVKRRGKVRYILSRIFIPIQSVKRFYPYFYQHKMLLPFLPLYRLLKRFHSAKEEIQLLFKL